MQKPAPHLDSAAKTDAVTKILTALPVNQKFVTLPSVILEADVQQYCLASHDHNELHKPGEPANNGPFGAPVAHGMLVAGRSIAIAGNIQDFMRLHPIHTEIKGWEFVRPVFFGDAITVELTITDAFPILKGRAIALTCSLVTKNQKGKIVGKGAIVAQIPVT